MIWYDPRRVLKEKKFEWKEINFKIVKKKWKLKQKILSKHQQILLITDPQSSI